MLAVEFETNASNGVIRVPQEYRDVVDGPLKIIVLKRALDDQPSLAEKKKNIRKHLKQIREKKVFQAVEDPVKWQRDLRNEWE